MSTTWERNPSGTRKRMLAEIRRDHENGYLTDREAARLRDAANRLYLRAIKEIKK
jgi:hypothetical protein